MEDELDYFIALNNRKFTYIKMYDKTMMCVWEKLRTENGWHKERAGRLDVCKVDIETLKKFKIWDDLTPEVQQKVTDRTMEEKEAVHKLMGKARAGRRKQYEGVPRELTCIECGAKKAIQPGLLLKKIEIIAKTKGATYAMTDYLADYRCQKCRPSRGRKSTGQCKPVELICKCGNKVTYPANILLKMATKKNITSEEFVKKYVCQKCCGTKGRPRNSKKTSTE